MPKNGQFGEFFENLRHFGRFSNNVRPWQLFDCLIWKSAVARQSNFDQSIHFSSAMMSTPFLDCIFGFAYCQCAIKSQAIVIEFISKSYLETRWKISSKSDAKCFKLAFTAITNKVRDLQCDLSSSSLILHFYILICWSHEGVLEAVYCLVKSPTFMLFFREKTFIFWPLQ